MTELTKARIVFDLTGASTANGAHFICVDGATVEHMTISWEAFRDMDSPRHITVTIEPGDRLNEERQ